MFLSAESGEPFNRNYRPLWSMVVHRLQSYTILPHKICSKIIINITNDTIEVDTLTILPLAGYNLAFNTKIPSVNINSTVRPIINILSITQYSLFCDFFVSFFVKIY